MHGSEHPLHADPEENSGRMLQEDLDDIYAREEEEEECSGSLSPSEPFKES